MRAQQESTEEEPVVTASVGYLGSPVGLALEHALPAFPSLRAALVSPPSEMGEVDEAVAALAEEVKNPMVTKKQHKKECAFKHFQKHFAPVAVEFEFDDLTYTHELRMRWVR